MEHILVRTLAVGPRLIFTVLFTALTLLSIVGFANPASALVAGDLDTTFGGDGKVTANIDDRRGDEANAIALQPDGKIVSVGTVAGYTSTTSAASWTSDFAVTRHNADGTLDTTFGGGDGKVVTNPGALDSPTSPRRYSHAQDVVIQPDGKIVVVGWIGPHALDADDGNFVLVRYNPDGSLDTTFGAPTSPFDPPTQGIVETNFGGTYFEGALAVALQPDGRIVAAGYGPNGSAMGYAVARYMPNGTLDNTFGGGDGYITTDAAIAGSYPIIDDIVLQPDGKLVAVGYFHDWNENESGGENVFNTMRFNTGGTFDTSFGGGDGRVQTYVESRFGGSIGQARSVVLQPDGKIVVTGGDSQVAMARYDSSGALDTTFGGGDGKATGAPGFPGESALQEDGKLVVASATYGGDGSAENPNEFIVSRYNTDGSIDTSFGNHGMSSPTFTSIHYAGAHGIVVQPDGKIVAAGYADYETGVQEFALARFEDKTTPDTANPTISGMSPRPGSTIRDHTPTIKATVKDDRTNLQKSNLQLYIKGTLISQTKYSYSASTDVLTYNLPRLSRGKKTVKIVATDAAGNVGTKSWYFTIK